MERKLNTIQKHNNLNEVYAVDLPGPGGASHHYAIERDGKLLQAIRFQEGPRNEEGSQPGAAMADLLEICRDQLLHFQRGHFACRENACALTHIEEALMWLDRRAEDRAQREVLGRNEE